MVYKQCYKVSASSATTVTGQLPSLHKIYSHAHNVHVSITLSILDNVSTLY